jgi:DNA-binding CsgD family transcriptional regulator
MACLLHRGLDVRDFSLRAARVIGRAVPFDGVCVLTMDPATLLPTSEIVENGLPDSATPRMAEIELAERDFNKFTQLARRRSPAASLSEATNGKLDRSLRHRELKRPHGFGDELRAALVSDFGGDDPDGRPPAVIRAAARRARAVATGTAENDLVASGRVRTQAGRWLSVRASMLGEHVAVILECARPPELAPLIAHAYGLTERERSVTQLVAQGLPTNEIAKRLHLAPYTVQDHLKSIFEKTGVGTRGELVARLFFDHYAPRLSGGA